MISLGGDKMKDLKQKKELIRCGICPVDFKCKENVEISDCNDCLWIKENTEYNESIVHVDSSYLVDVIDCR